MRSQCAQKHSTRAEQRREKRAEEGKTDLKRVKEAPQGVFEGRWEDQLHVQGGGTGFRREEYYDHSKNKETVINISRELIILDKNANTYQFGQRLDSFKS